MLYHRSLIFRSPCIKQAKWETSSESSLAPFHSWQGQRGPCGETSSLLPGWTFHLSDLVTLCFLLHPAPLFGPGSACHPCLTLFSPGVSHKLPGERRWEPGQVGELCPNLLLVMLVRPIKGICSLTPQKKIVYENK